MARSLLLAAVVALALLWRLPVTGAEWHLLSCDADSLFHLHRAALCARDYPRVQSIDLYSHFPSGYRVHWMAPLTVAYATILRAAGLQGAELESQAALLSWIPPILGVIAILLAARIARRCDRNHPVDCLAALLIAVDGDSYRTFFFGFIDHHMFATLAILALVLARLRGDLALWFATLTLVLATTPEATFLVAIFLGVVGLAELAAAAALQASPLSRRGLWFFAPGLAAVVALVAERAFETDPLPLALSSWFYFTDFQPLLLLSMGGVLCGLTIWASAHRRRRPIEERVVGLVVLGVSLVTCAVLLTDTPGIFGELTGRLAKADRLMVTEERTLWHLWFYSPRLQLTSICGLASIVRFLLSVRRGADSGELFRWLAFAAAFALGLTEVRWARVVSSLEMVGVAVLLFDALAYLRAIRWYSSALFRVLPGALGFAALFWIVMWPNLQDRARSHGDFCGQQRVIEEAAAWLRQRTPPVEGEPLWGVVAPWEWGHHLHVLGRAPVVFDPLNNRYDDRREMIDVLRDVWSSRSGGELQEALQRYRARYLVLYEPFNDITGILGAEAWRKPQFLETAPNGGVVLGEALNQFAAFRLFTSRGLATETGELQLQLTSLPIELDKPDGKVTMPRLQIYELKPGATIEGIVPRAAGFCTIGFEVRWSDSQVEQVNLKGPLDARGRFRYKTSLPAPFRGHGFEIPKPYLVACGSWKRRVEVSAGAVDRGEVIRIGEAL